MNINSAINPMGRMLVWISLLAFSGVGCSEDQTAKSGSGYTEPPKAEEPKEPASGTPGFIPPPGTKLIAIVDKDGKLALRGPRGEELESCLVCTPELRKELLTNKTPIDCMEALDEELKKNGVCGRFDQFKGPPFGAATYSFSVLELPGSKCTVTWWQGNTLHGHPPGCTP